MNCRHFTLHLGAHRTGTTSLQALLDANRANLNRRSIDVLTPPRQQKRDTPTVRDAFKRRSQQFGLFHRFRWASKLLSSRIASSLRTDIQGLADRSATRIVLSDENFLGFAIQMTGSRALYPDAGTRLELLGSSIAGADMRIFLAIRPYDDFMLSYYLMQSIYGPGIEEFAPFHRTACQLTSGWPGIVESIRRAFPGAPVTVWLHGNINLSARFADLTGVEPDGLGQQDEQVKFHTAPTREAIAAFRNAPNRQTLSKASRDDLVERHASGTRFHVDEFFSASERQHLKDRYARHAEMLASLPGVTLK